MNPWRRWRVPVLFSLVILLPVLLAAGTVSVGAGVWTTP